MSKNAAPPPSFGGRMRDIFVEPAILRAAGRRARSGPIRDGVSPARRGVYDEGQELAMGRFTFAGAERDVSEVGLWAPDAPSLAWAEVAHSFSWLPHLDAVGNIGARTLAQEVVESWIKAHKNYDPLVWRVDIAARRLRSWLEHLHLIARGTGAEDERRGAALSASIAQHADWVARKQQSARPGLEQVIVSAAVMTSTFVIDDWAPRRADAAENLEKTLKISLQADGGALSRRPTAMLEMLELLTALNEDFEHFRFRPPAELAIAIDKLASGLRFLRLGDGGLPLFHGGAACEVGALDLALARALTDIAAPSAMPHTRYARVKGGRVGVVMDVGGAPEGLAAEEAHASALAVEVFAGRRRLIVASCGGARHLDDAEKRGHARTAQAQSGVEFDEHPCARPRGSSSPRFAADAPLEGPPNVAFEYRPEQNGVWMNAVHDGYLQPHGVVVRRRVYLSLDGGDLRGEDEAEVQDQRRFQAHRDKARDARIATGAPLISRFHLHPDVSADLIADGQAVKMELPHGETWVMRHAGARLSLERSYVRLRYEAARPSRQIVLRAGLTREKAQIRWAFRRVGDLEHAPLDIAALIDLKGMESA